MKNVNIKLKVAHSIPGRARIKVTSGFDPKVFFLVLEAGLREVKIIKRADSNPYSQSVTLFFKKDLDVAEILKELKQVLSRITEDPEFLQRLEDIKDILDYGHKENPDVSVRNHILSVSHGLDRTVRRMTGSTIDMRTAVPMTSVASGLALLLLAPGLPTPTWLVLITFGITSFHLLKHEHPDGQEISLLPDAGGESTPGLLEAPKPA